MKRTDIYVNGDYYKKNPTWDAADSIWKAQWIKKLIDRNPINFKEVVEIGCGTGNIVKELSDFYPRIESWSGYDISPQAIALAQKNITKKISFFNQDFLQENKKTQLALTIDVVEHVANYYEFFEKLKAKSDYFIFHIPLDLCCHTVLKPHILLQQRESVGHIHYFTKEMVEWILEDTGYTVLDWFYTKPMLDLLPQISLRNKLKKKIRNTSFSLSEDTSAKWWGGYSMMILAR